MDLREVARRMALLANLLVIVSLFLTVLAWHLSVGLFIACWFLYGLAWVLEGGAVRRELAASARRQAVPLTTPE